MTEVRFYHLTRRSLEQVLPGLLEKTLTRGWRAVVLTGTEERADALDLHLWTYRPDSFLPHGTGKDGTAADQPILLRSEDGRPNGAQVLFQVDGVETTLAAEFELVCDLFDGNDPDAVTAARGRWRRAKDSGHDLTYWQQTESGGWTKKA